MQKKTAKKKKRSILFPEGFPPHFRLNHFHSKQISFTLKIDQLFLINDQLALSLQHVCNMPAT